MRSARKTTHSFFPLAERGILNVISSVPTKDGSSFAPSGTKAAQAEILSFAFNVANKLSQGRDDQHLGSDRGFQKHRNPAAQASLNNTEGKTHGLVSDVNLLFVPWA